MASVKRLCLRWRSERGVELIEFSLTLPLLLLVTVGITEFGLLFREYEIVTNAAREGARVAVLSSYTTTDAETRVDQYLTAGGLDALLATRAVTGTFVPLGAGCMPTMTANVTYPHPLPFLNGVMNYFGSSLGTITVRASAVMRAEYPLATCP
jgi:Flp pilus assembly protein TadG